MAPELNSWVSPNGDPRWGAKAGFEIPHKVNQPPCRLLKNQLALFGGGPCRLPEGPVFSEGTRTFENRNRAAPEQVAH